MAITPLKVLLFLAGASGAASGTAYVAGAFDPYLTPPQSPAKVAALDGSDADADPAKPAPAVEAPKVEPPAAAEAKPAPDKPAEGAAPADPAKPPMAEKPAEADPAKPAEQNVAAADPAAEKSKPETSAPAPVAPTFDLLRVEPDGSIVIAGQAMPGSSVEVIAGSKVLAKVDAGSGGDFVAILDEPLKPGDYQIVLRATHPGPIVLTSIETAVVSVPETKDGQVLALVEQPGAPSKLITAPAPEPKPAEPAEAAAAAPGQPDAPKTDEKVAAAPAEQPTEPAAPPLALGTAITVAVEAVEIDGRKIFVAGAAPAGMTVRIYANDMMLGDAKASPENRFLLETERDLKVGDYIIRADVLSKDGSKVLARAAVPFAREPGESIAAVAPLPADSAAQPPANRKPAPPPDDVGAVVIASSEEPKPAQPDASAPPVSDPAKPQEQADATRPAPANSTQPAKPADSAAVPAPAKPADTAAAPPPADGSAPKPSEPANVAAADPAAPPAVEATAPKLQPAASGVIIRRGDSLWQISKRVYGRGTRYSTIYVANKDQIRDPDRIWPGQIFRVPEKSDRGEDADMKAIGGQATTVQ